MGRGIDWAAEDVAQLRQWLEGGRQHQDEAEAAASRCARPGTSAEEAAIEGSFGGHVNRRPMVR